MADDVPVTDLIRAEVEGGIARLTIDRPEAGNSLTPAMRDHLADTFDDLSATLGVRVYGTLLDSDTAIFCVGSGDLNCLVRTSGSIFFQGEAFLGLSFRF